GFSGPEAFAGDAAADAVAGVVEVGVQVAGGVAVFDDVLDDVHVPGENAVGVAGGAGHGGGVPAVAFAEDEAHDGGLADQAAFVGAQGDVPGVDGAGGAAAVAVGED